MWITFASLIYLTLNNAQKESDFYYGINTLTICLVTTNFLWTSYIKPLKGQSRFWRFVFIVLAATGGLIGYFVPYALTAEKQFISAIYGMAWGVLFGLCLYIGRILLNLFESLFALLCQRMAAMLDRGN